MTTQQPLVQDEDFASLFEKSQHQFSDAIQEGEIVKGKVISIGHDTVVVDFGYKSEGMIPRDEFTSYTGELTVQEGDEVEVYIESIDIDHGLPVLSKEKADALKIWDRLQEVVDTDSSIEGVVIAKVKGGLSVDIGVKAFLPASQIDVRLPSNLDKLIGKKFKFKILKLNKRKGNIIVSRRALIEKDRDYAKNEIMQNLAEGQVVSGTVKNLTDYGAFIDLGGVDGLLHITDMTWGRIGHPSEILAVGQDVNVKVLKIDPDTGKVSLGLKQLTTDPWEHVTQNYPVGTRLNGKVVSIADYGAFVEIEKGVEGLVHISEMSWSRKSKHPSKIVNVGDQVEAVILDIDPNSRRISLGMKQIHQNPWEVIARDFPIGTLVKRAVKNVTDFGLFVGLTDDIDGLIHVSDVSWVRLARPLSAAFPKKTEVEAVVTSIDVDNERVSLSMKQLTPTASDPWDRLRKDFGIGSRHQGKVVWLGDKGMAIEIGEHLEGFIPRSEFPSELVAESVEITKEVLADIAKKLPLGSAVETVVHSLDDKEHRILLGLVQK